MDPLAWIHRAEARSIAAELGAPLVEDFREGKVLLRLSDPVMRRVVRESKGPYCGPGSAALERCYDKYAAHGLVTAAGIDAPGTSLASVSRMERRFILKPRRGSDSIGVRIVDAIPANRRSEDWIVQERVIGEELTVAIFREQVGMPLRILLPPGTPYSFLRKYVLRPGRTVLRDEGLREAALKIARLLGVDWAARVDFIVRGGKAFFLECDAAPLVGPGSAFAESFAAAGVARTAQLRWLSS